MHKAYAHIAIETRGWSCLDTCLHLYLCMFEQQWLCQLCAFAQAFVIGYDPTLLQDRPYTGWPVLHIMTLYMRPLKEYHAAIHETAATSSTHTCTSVLT